MGTLEFDGLSWVRLVVVALMLGMAIAVAALRCCRQILKRLDNDARAREELYALVAEMKPYLVQIKEHDLAVRAAAIKSTRAASQVQSLLDRAKKSRASSRQQMPISVGTPSSRVPIRHQGTLKR